MALLQKVIRTQQTALAWSLARRAIHKLQPASGYDNYFQKLPPSDIQPRRLLPLRGYLYLPGNHDPGMPQYANGARENYPFALHCHNGNDYSLQDWGKIVREVLDDYLPEHSAVLIRGLPIAGHEDFSTLMQNTKYKLMNYNFGSDRRETAGYKTFGASIEASPVLIEMHTEGSYMPDDITVIRKVVFYSHKPCREFHGGETPICRISEVTKRLDPSFLEKLRTKQLTYYRIMEHPDQDPITNWKTRMGAKNEEEAETNMKKLGVQWRWNPNGSVTYWHTKPAFKKHPITGEEILFSQFTTHHKSYCDYVSSYKYSDNWEDYAAGTHCVYGDGEEIADEDLQAYRNAQWQVAVTVPLQKGDIIFMDNFECQHGRFNYHGDRKMFISLTAD